MILIWSSYRHSSWRLRHCSHVGLVSSPDHLDKRSLFPNLVHSMNSTNTLRDVAGMSDYACVSVTNEHDSSSETCIALPPSGRAKLSHWLSPLSATWKSSLLGELDQRKRDVSKSSRLGVGRVEVSHRSWSH